VCVCACARACTHACACGFFIFFFVLFFCLFVWFLEGGGDFPVIKILYLEQSRTLDIVQNNSVSCLLLVPSLLFFFLLA